MQYLVTQVQTFLVDAESEEEAAAAHADGLASATGVLEWFAEPSDTVLSVAS